MCEQRKQLSQISKKYVVRSLFFYFFDQNPHCHFQWIPLLKGLKTHSPTLRVVTRPGVPIDWGDSPLYLKESILPLERFYAHLLGLTAPLTQPEIQPALTSISLHPFARRQILNRLELKGAVQWGLLLGERQGEHLQIRFVLPAGQRHPSHSPFGSWNTPYLLGASETLIPLCDSATDWHGVWVIQPDSHLASVTTDLLLTELAQNQGLLDDQQPLLSIGWQDGILTVQAYKYIDEVTLVSLPVTL